MILDILILASLELNAQRVSFGLRWIHFTLLRNHPRVRIELLLKTERWMSANMQKAP